MVETVQLLLSILVSSFRMQQFAKGSGEVHHISVPRCRPLILVPEIHATRPVRSYRTTRESCNMKSWF